MDRSLSHAVVLLTALLLVCCGPDLPPDHELAALARISRPLTGPGSKVTFYNFPNQKSATDPDSWGAVLLDIERHLPAQYGTTYQDKDKQTHGHETTHGINAHLRNYHNKTGVKANAFYVLQDRAFIIPEPKIGKSQAAAYVPQALRGFRFSTYVTGQTAWENEPLYLFDEWVAYVNGGKVGINRFQTGKWSGAPGSIYGVVDGALEFTVYATALVMAVEKGHSAYLPQHPQFKEFFAWYLVQAMDTFRVGNAIPPFKLGSQQKQYGTLMGSAGASIRGFVTKLYGSAFCDRVFKGTPLPPPKKDSGTVKKDGPKKDGPKKDSSKKDSSKKKKDSKAGAPIKDAATPPGGDHAGQESIQGGCNAAKGGPAPSLAALAWVFIFWAALGRRRPGISGSSCTAEGRWPRPWPRP